MAFLKANIPIFSNAKNYRRADHVPLVVPVVNTSHIIPLLDSQRQLYGVNRRGFMVTNANCSTTGLVVPLKALQDKFGTFSQVSAVTMQAISGAGKSTEKFVLTLRRIPRRSKSRYPRQRSPLHWRRRRKNGMGNIQNPRLPVPHHHHRFPHPPNPRLSP